MGLPIEYQLAEGPSEGYAIKLASIHALHRSDLPPIVLFIHFSLHARLCSFSLVV